MPGDEERGAGIKVLRRAVMLLRILATAAPGRGMHLVEVAKSAKLPPSTTHRLLSALEQDGLVTQEPGTRDYRLGGELLVLGLRVREGLSLRRQAHPVMQALAQETGEDVYLGIRRGGESLLIEMAAGGQAVRLSERVGERMPLHRGAVSRVLLAHLDPLLIDAYVQGTGDLAADRGKAEARRLARELASIRERGHAVSTGEYSPDSAALAAPVWDFTGSVVAALCILLPRTRLRKERQEWLVARVTTAAAALSSRMGHARTHEPLPPPDTGRGAG